MNVHKKPYKSCDLDVKIQEEILSEIKILPFKQIFESAIVRYNPSNRII